MASLFTRLGSIPARYPFYFGVGVSCAKTSFSDYLVQTVVERKEKVDWKRNAAFAAFGFFYLGGVQYGIYVKLFGRMFPNAGAFAAKPIREKLKDFRGIFNVGAQVLLDQCLHHPIMYFPAFYITKELVTSDKPDITRVIRNYRANISEDMVALWKIWVPATLINFAFMPMYARIPFTAAVSLVWTMVLSAMRGGDVVHGDDMVGGAVTGATLHLVEEGFEELFYSCPVDLDKAMSHVVVSASGPDKVGWVSMLARAVADHGGNVTHSKMVRLGKDFIIMMHISIAPEHQKNLVCGLNNNKELKPLNLRTTCLQRRGTGKFEQAAMGLRIHCVGEDRPGMLAAISEKISEKGMSVENMTTELRMSKGGRREFVIDADCTSAHHLEKDSLNGLIGDFSGLKDSLDLDIMDIRVHKVAPAR